jgi:hypothetical protein
MMHAALDINMPNCASAIVATREVVDAIGSFQPAVGYYYRACMKEKGHPRGWLEFTAILLVTMKRRPFSSSAGSL